MFGKVNPKSTIGQEEIFGPVLSIITYKDEDDAVRIANDTIYGLAGGVWSKDEARASASRAACVPARFDVNGGAFNINAPFGGFEQSGHGREAGKYGFEEFLNTHVSDREISTDLTDYSLRANVRGVRTAKLAAETLRDRLIATFEMFDLGAEMMGANL